MSTLKANNFEHLDATTASVQTTVGGGTILVGISTCSNGLNVTSGEVGIGTDDPTNLLHIDGGTDQIKLSDGTGSFELRAGNAFFLKDNGTTRLQVTSDGDVRIGDLPTQNVGATAGLQIGNTGTPQQRFVRNDDSMGDGDVIGEISSYTNAAQGGQTYNRSGSIKFKAADTLTTNNRATKITFEVAPNNTANEAPQERLVILPNGNLQITNGDLVMNSGKGIDFSDTDNITGTSSEILDYYEEGTYTVSLTSGSGSITLNSSSDTFAYTKIGRLVYIQGFITVSSSSASGSLSFNIPFNADLSMPEDADNGHMPIIVNGTSKDCDRFAVAYNNTTTMSVITTDSTTAASASVADLFGSGDNIIVSFNYLASS